LSLTEEQLKSLHTLGLSIKEGVFHALIEMPLGLCLEVALHGASTIEEALQALQSLTPLRVMPSTL